LGLGVGVGVYGVWRMLYVVVCIVCALWCMVYIMVEGFHLVDYGSFRSPGLGGSGVRERLLCLATCWINVCGAKEGFEFRI